MKFSEMKYERVDFDRLKEDFKSLMERFDRAESGEEQLELHREYYRLSDRVMTQSTIAMIRSDIDMTDEFYFGEQEYYDSNMPLFRKLSVDYQRKLYSSSFRPYLEEKIGSVAFKNMELSMRAMDDKLIPLMQEENRLSTEYNKLLASAKIEWDGESLNLSLLTPYLTGRDRGVRQRAWDKYTEFFSSHQEELDDYYDRLVRNRSRQGEALGYKNYLPLGYDRMNRNSYGPSDVAEFRKQVKRDLVPFAAELHDRRRQRLGLSSLSYIDENVYFREGNPQPVGSPDDILRAGQRLYRELSPETGEFMDRMLKDELFDVLGRKTKKTGGYMTMLPDYGVPFIFANFNGTSGDVDVITHECGHAFQGYVTADYPVHEHNDITMETAETHSMSMEFFTEPWMPLLFGDRAEDYLSMHFEDAVCFIPYGTMVDEFQHIVYENTGLSPRDRRQVWRELEREYKPHLDYSGNSYLEQGGFWQKQHHIYDSPLYYIDYCIAGINALQYKAWMKKDFKAAWESYLSLCRLSASDFFPGLLKKSGLDNPFHDGSMKRIIAGLKES